MPPRPARDFARLELAAGQTVFVVGDPGDAVYLVESGECEILVPDATQGLRRIDVAGPEYLFGEVALLDGGPRTATVRALVPTALVRIERAHVQTLLAGADPLLSHLLHLLIERFRSERAARLQAAAGARAGTGPAPTVPAEKTSHRALQALALAHDLEEAVTQGHLALHYQPIVHLASGGVAGFEGLIRWHHPEHGSIPPDRFIPAAERTGAIRHISHWVLNRALDDWPRLAALCVAAASEPGFVSINLSAPELADHGVVDTIGTSLRVRGIAPAHLRIEMTETTMVSDPERVGGVIECLRSAGIGVSLDDFGTGHAGLSTLQALPVSCLKIDRAFVARLGQAGRSLQIVKSALELARPLGLSTVAEGIEDGATARRLQELGCTYGQGYHYARPLPIDELAAWAASRSA
jgi:EAL domain-containing protein (putative c-di-GMP-specific phosphodiesterase class I)/CRP-like cAMP-binding protein